MNKNDINSKISNFITNITKQSSKYSKLAKKEFNLMMLLEKKNHLIEELGLKVYKLAKQNKSLKNSEVDKLINYIKKIETEEAKINRPVKTASVSTKTKPKSKKVVKTTTKRRVKK